MKNKVKLSLLAMLLICCAAASAFAGVNAADTSSDPLVTMSYIEQVLAPRIKNELINYIDKTYAPPKLPEDTGVEVPGDNTTEPPIDNTTPPVDNVAQGYVVVNMKQGQKLLAKSPAEIILRSGKAIAITPFADQGVCDMTDGSELYNHEELPRYHYCLIPRGDDGRGIVAITDEIYIMVRGEFEISE